MGCAGSSSAATDADERQNDAAQQNGKAAAKLAVTDAPIEAAPVEHVALSDESKTKSASTRARRLSYVTADANGQPNGAPHAGGAPGSAPVIANGDTGATNSTKGASTRARRLSYITNDPNVKIQKPGAPDTGLEDAEQSEAVEMAQQMGGTGTGGKRTLTLSVACMSRAGREPGFKKTNQDNCFAFEKYISDDQSLFGAMDGHGPHGHLVSGFVKQHLPIILVNHLTMDKDPEHALTSGFMEVDKGLANSRIDCEFSGSTCVISFLKGRTLTTAWVGDSRGVLAREVSPGVFEAQDLTWDHKPTMPEEKARILKTNGRVERLVDEMGQPMGPPRVWLQYAWIPGLAMSRALGDVLAHQVGVSSEPDCTVLDVCDQDRFIVLASDGVWEFITSQEAVDIIAQYDSAEEGCRQLVDEAYQRWLTEEEGVVDDITAVLVKFIQ